MIDPTNPSLGGDGRIRRTRRHRITDTVGDPGFDMPGTIAPPDHAERESEANDRAAAAERDAIARAELAEYRAELRETSWWRHAARYVWEAYGRIVAGAIGVAIVATAGAAFLNPNQVGVIVMIVAAVLAVRWAQASS